VLQLVTAAPRCRFACLRCSGGEVAGSIADVAALEVQLSPSWVEHMLRPYLFHRGTPLVSDSSMPQSANRLLVLEANMPEASILAACTMASKAGVPVVLEPVSEPKALRAVASCQHLAWVTPNVAELHAMATRIRARWQHGTADASQQATVGHSFGTSTRRPYQHRHACCRLMIPPSQPPCPTLLPADIYAPMVNRALQEGALMPPAVLGALDNAAVLLGAGVKRVVVTLGAHGAALFTTAKDTSVDAVRALSDGDSGCSLQSGQSGQFGAELASQAKLPAPLVVTYLPALAVEAVVSLSGAGDTLVGGLVAGLLAGLGDEAALAVGMAAARRTVESVDNVCPSLSMSDCGQDALQLLKRAQRWELR
jgi:sugar/nucleoside kinase (ribokinase family)